MTGNLDDLRSRAEQPNALHGCSSDPCGSVVCQTARDRDTLLAELENWKSTAISRGEHLEQAEQAVARVLEQRDKWEREGSHYWINAEAADIALDYALRALDGAS